MVVERLLTLECTSRMPREINSITDSEFDLRVGNFYTLLVLTLTYYLTDQVPVASRWMVLRLRGLNRKYVVLMQQSIPWATPWHALLSVSKYLVLSKKVLILVHPFEIEAMATCSASGKTQQSYLNGSQKESNF